MKRGPTLYPWISESMNVLRAVLPCSVKDAVALLVEKMPKRAMDAVKSKSRTSMAKKIVSGLIRRRYLSQHDDTLCVIQRSRKSSIGDHAIKIMQNAKSVVSHELGFTKSSIRTYRRHLLKLGWIAIEKEAGVERWAWTGPQDAAWSTVSQLNMKTRQTNR